MVKVVNITNPKNTRSIDLGAELASELDDAVKQQLDCPKVGVQIRL